MKNKSRGVVSNANVCLFSSFVIANDLCAGSTCELTTNPFGSAGKFGIAPGNYIAIFRAQFGKLVLKFLDNIFNLWAREIRRRMIILR